MARALRLLPVLCTALLLATAVRAVTYGEPGIGSQYQLFGRPITDTSAIHSASTVVPGQMSTQVLPLEGEGDAQRTAAKAVGAGAAAKQKCEENYLYSEVFGKCLPAPGKDGYIGAAEHDKGKGKALPSHSGFAPFGSAAADVHMPLPLRAIPIKSLPLRTAAFNREQQPQPQPQPAQQPPSQAGAAGQPARAVAPVQQLRLACPAGFTYNPAMAACIAPASMFGPQQLQQAMAMRRGDDDDDDNDDGDELRRDLMMRARRHRMRHRMFGRRFGGPRILAPVFVFVLPPNALDRNATMRLGQHFGRVHEVHPSFVGGGTGDRRTASDSRATPSGPAAADTTKPATPVPAPAPAPADKPKGSPPGTGAGEPADKSKGLPAGTGTGTGAGEEKALRGAFVNPIVTGSSGGEALPLKATATGSGDESQTRAQPLMGADRDSAAVPALQQRAEFISPFVAQEHNTA